MSRKENIAYYKIVHYKLLLFALLIPGALADHDECAQDLTVLYLLIGTMMALVLFHALTHLWWARRLLAALKLIPREEALRVMTSLHGEYK